MKIEKFPSSRKHTLYFLEEARAISPIYLDILIDMESALNKIKILKNEGKCAGVNSLLLWAIAQSMKKMPQMNLGVSGKIRAFQMFYSSVMAKITLDKTSENQRIVCSALIPHIQKMSIHEIQLHLDFYKNADFDKSPCFDSLKILQRLPSILAYLIYRRLMARLQKRVLIHGSFALTSLSHSSISGFYPLSGGSLTFGVGRISDQAIIQNGEIKIGKILRLCVTFDHRALDGALVSEFLESIKNKIETFN